MERHLIKCTQVPEPSGDVDGSQNAGTETPTSSKSTKSSNPKQSKVTSFAVVKKGLTKSQSEQLKLVELKFVVKGLHSYLSVENDGLVDLAQFCVGIGATSGNIDVRNCWYGRKTVREVSLQEFEGMTAKIVAAIAEPLQDGNVACTTDMWTDDHVKRSYLKFTIFWIDDTFQLRHTMARCKVFPPERHTGVNIRRELEVIMDEFGLPHGDTPTTTDAGSNFIAALSEAARYQCMAHRTNTVLIDAWKNTIPRDEDFRQFTEDVRSLVSYVTNHKLLANRLPKKLQKESGTRQWRSFHLVHEAVYESYDVLETHLQLLQEVDRISGISKELTGKIASFFAKFSAMFDRLESASEPSLQYVIPMYYAVVDSICKPCSTDPGCIALLKSEIARLMGENTGLVLQRSTKLQHCSIQLSRISNFWVAIRKSSVSKPRNSTISDELASYLGNNSKSSKNPLNFWRDNATRYPLLSKIAKKVLVVQASSGESERHFSEASNIVTGTRSLLDPSAVESLVVLKEAPFHSY